jgi:serine/threonine protein kinase
VKSAAEAVTEVVEESCVRPSTFRRKARKLSVVAPSAHVADVERRGVPETGRLGRYTLLAPVARGGMGTIWAARDGVDGPLVAVKTLHAEGANDPSLRTMFLDEARVATAVRHPNVCHVVEAGEDRGTLYLAMEWIEGDALHTIVAKGMHLPERGAFPEEMALRVVRRLARALAAAHALRDAQGQPLGLVHRDVSPHNVLLSVDGQVKLIDFGIAKTRQRLSQTTRSGVIKGKLKYMAPEQVDGGDVDLRADVWALGAVLYFLVSGEELFEDLSEADVVRTLVMREPLREPTRPFAPDIGTIVRRALAFERDDRFSSMAEVEAAVDACLTQRRCSLEDTVDARALAAFCVGRIGVEVAARKIEVDRAVTAMAHKERPKMRVWPLVASASLLVAFGVVAALVGRERLASQVASEPLATPTLAAIPSASAAPISAPAPRASEVAVVEPEPAPSSSTVTANSPKKQGKVTAGKAPPKKPSSEFDHHD